MSLSIEAVRTKDDNKVVLTAKIYGENYKLIKLEKATICRDSITSKDIEELINEHDKRRHQKSMYNGSR